MNTKERLEKIEKAVVELADAIEEGSFHQMGKFIRDILKDQ